MSVTIQTAARYQKGVLDPWFRPAGARSGRLILRWFCRDSIGSVEVRVLAFRAVIPGALPPYSGWMARWSMDFRSAPDLPDPEGGRLLPLVPAQALPEDVGRHQALQGGCIVVLSQP